MAKGKRVKAESENSEQLPRDTVAMRAYEIWCRRGMPHGADQQDWFDAEQELLPKPAKKKPSTSRKTRS